LTKCRVCREGAISHAGERGDPRRRKEKIEPVVKFAYLETERFSKMVCRTGEASARAK